ncbi:thiol-disulfide oxidoreductase [Rubripirellula obstinata]|uniref:Thiol-disulfide oxidoreductase n=2 Tax=Rubripirellula obstinata TaxID=406547 RepID=A0A5B1CIE9_9BACT|nr:thiol-disulfide oxidoreductase [Rubripirellula obstinata]
MIFNKGGWVSLGRWVVSEKKGPGGKSEIFFSLEKACRSCRNSRGPATRRVSGAVPASQTCRETGETEFSSTDMIYQDSLCTIFLEIDPMCFLNGPLACRRLAFCWILCWISLSGCSSPVQETTDQPADAETSQADIPDRMMNEDAPPANRLVQNAQNQTSQAPDFLPKQPPADNPSASTEPSAPVNRFPLAVADPGGEKPGRGLRADLTADELVEFLATADKDMQTIVSGASGISDPEKARDTLIQIVKMKWEASRRLAEDQNVSDKLRSEGNRGQLQALSHLASLGDLKAAKDLESLAKANLDSDDDALVSDSRLVLIGFGIEDLRNGVEEAPENIVGLVRQLASTASDSDVPAMMVMGQARGLLANYGHDLQAKEVRDTIIDLFANSPDPNIAKMAAAMAGNVRFDAIDSMVNQIATGKNEAAENELAEPASEVTVAEWVEAAETLIDESADLQTVQYLSGAAIEFESRNRMDLAEATYQVMKRRFTDRDAATYQELMMAVSARNAREDAIGREFDFSLPSVDGRPINISDYRGRVVLMPFWTIDFPQSLQILPALKQWSDKAPGKIAIVGMNLDTDADRVQTFTEKSGLDFPSFRAPNPQGTDPEAGDDALALEDTGSGNPAAAQFGVVSLPCVVIFDQQGKVVKIDFAGRQLDQTIKELINP